MGWAASLSKFRMKNQVYILIYFPSLKSYVLSVIMFFTCHVESMKKSVVCVIYTEWQLPLGDAVGLYCCVYNWDRAWKFSKKRTAMQDQLKST